MHVRFIYLAPLHKPVWCLQITSVCTILVSTQTVPPVLLSKLQSGLFDLTEKFPFEMQPTIMMAAESLKEGAARRVGPSKSRLSRTVRSTGLERVLMVVLPHGILQ